MSRNPGRNPFDAVRDEVAELLGIDLTKQLTVHQKTRLDLAAATRFDIVADIEKLKVGAVVDPEKMSQRAALFERLVPMAAASDPNAPGTKRARKALLMKLMSRIRAVDAETCKKLRIENVSDLERVRELGAKAIALGEENERLRTRISEMEAELALTRATPAAAGPTNNAAPPPAIRADNPWAGGRSIYEADVPAEPHWLDRINRRAW